MVFQIFIILSKKNLLNISFRNLSNLEKYGSGIEKIIEDCINGYLHNKNL